MFAPLPRKTRGHRRKWGHCPELGRKPRVHPERWRAVPLALESSVSGPLWGVALEMDTPQD